MSYNPISGGGGVAIGAAVSGGPTNGAALYVDNSGNLANNLPTGVASVITYDPTAFFPANANRVFWNDFGDTAKLTKAGGGTPANGDSVSAAADKISGTSIWSNVGASQPVYRTGLANGHGGLQFNSQKFTAVSLDYVKNTNFITFCTVLACVGAADAGNRKIFAVDNTSGSQDRFYVNMNNGKALVTVARTDAETGAATQVTVQQVADTYSAMLVEWNATNETISVYWNGAPTNKFNVDLSTLSCGTIVNTNSNAIQFGDTAGGNNKVLETFLFKDALMTQAQKDQWFLAVKSRYSLTLY